jgi:hypothetical protein
MNTKLPNSQEHTLDGHKLAAMSDRILTGTPMFVTYLEAV